MELPVKTKKKSRRIEEKTILLLEYQGKYAIQKRANKGLLAGLWELPSVEGKYSEQEIRTILKEENQQADIYELGAVDGRLSYYIGKTDRRGYLCVGNKTGIAGHVCDSDRIFNLSKRLHFLTRIVIVIVE